jgi:hypothetical protein
MLLSGKFPSLWKSKHRKVTLSGTPLLQRAVELRRRSLILWCCLPEPPLVEIALQRGAPAVFFYHAGENCSAEILLLEEIQA